MSIKRQGRPRWGPWHPTLFMHFSPEATYLYGGKPQLRKRQDDVLFDVDDAQELVLLGYAAMLEIGNGRLPDANTWEFVCQETTRVIWQGSEQYDQEEYWRKSLARLDALEWFTSTVGSLEIQFLHFELLRAQECGKPLENARTLWSMLCLLWIDRAAYFLIDQDAPQAVQHALKASEAIQAARPQLTRDDVRREMAKDAAAKKLEKDPKQADKVRVKAFWRAERKNYKSKAALARAVQDRFPDFLNLNVLTDWFRQWEKEEGRQSSSTDAPRR